MQGKVGPPCMPAHAQIAWQSVQVSWISGSLVVESEVCMFTLLIQIKMIRYKIVFIQQLSMAKCHSICNEPSYHRVMIVGCWVLAGAATL